MSSTIAVHNIAFLGHFAVVFHLSGQARGVKGSGLIFRKVCRRKARAIFLDNPGRLR
jgi:hypothetical protein